MADFGVKVTPVFELDGSGFAKFRAELDKKLKEAADGAKLTIKNISFEGDAKNISGFVKGIQDALGSVDFGKSLDLSSALKDTNAGISEISRHLLGIKSTLDSVSASLGSLGDAGASGMRPVLDSMQELSRMMDELNNKNFNIQNIIQPGGDTQAVTQLRVYREEAMELAKYVQRLFTAFTNVGTISADIFRVDKLRDAINDLSTMNMDTLFNKIGSAEEIGKIDAVRSQLMLYKDALEQCIAITQSHGIDIAMPDSSRLIQATENVRAYDAQAQSAAESMMKAAAAAQAENTAIEQVNAHAAQIKMDAPTAAASFDTLKEKLEAINGLLPSIGEGVRNAFNLDTQIADVGRLAEAYKELSVKISSVRDGMGAPTTTTVAGATEANATKLQQLRDDINAIVAELGDVASKIEQAFNFTPAITQAQNLKQEMATIIAMLNSIQQNAMAASGKFATIKLDGESRGELAAIADSFNNIGTSLSGLQEKIRTTFDLSGAISQAGELANQYANVKDALDTAASAGAKTGAAPAAGGSCTAGAGETNIAYIQQLIKMQEQLSVWIAKNGSAYAQNQQTIDSFASAISATIDSLQSKIDGYTNEVQQAGVVTENTLQGLRAALAQITGEAALQSAIEKEADKAAAALEKVTKAYNDMVAHTAGMSDASMFGGDLESIERYKQAMDVLAQRFDAVKAASRDERDAAVAAFNQQVNAVRNLETELNNVANEASKAESEANRAQAAFDKVAETYNQMVARMAGKSDAIMFGGDEESIERYNQAMEVLRQRFEDVKVSSGEARDAAITAFNQQVNVVRNLETELNNAAQAKRALNQANAELEKYRQQVESLSKLNTSGNNAVKFAGDDEAVNQYKAALDELRTRLEAIATASGSARDAAVASFQEQRKAVEDLRTSLNQAASDKKAMNAMRARAENLANTIEVYMAKNGALPPETLARLQEYINQLRAAGTIGRETFEEIQTGFRNISAQTRAANNGGKTFFQTLKEGWRKFGGWSIVSRSFMMAIRAFKNTVTAVKEIDSAMTELKKVTDETTVGYERFYNAAARTALSVGAKLSDTIDATADFARLGYTINEALQLAEAALVYKNVGDGINNIEEATESIISTIKAFGIAVSDAMYIVDMFNEVGKENLLPMPVVTRCLAECYIGQSSVGLCA